MRVNNTRTILSAWLNHSHRSRTGVGMNRFSRGGPTDTALYKNVPLPFFIMDSTRSTLKNSFWFQGLSLIRGTVPILSMCLN